MGRDRYKFGEAGFAHFLTCTVVGWLPVFTRPETVQVLLDSWQFLQDQGRLVLLGYVVLENHVHFIASSENLAKEVGGHIISELLFWIGPDKILYGSDYGIWTPKWLIDKFMAFEIPDDVTKETGSVLTLENKTKILGLNAARLYGIDIEAQKTKIKAAGGYAHLSAAVHTAR